MQEDEDLAGCRPASLSMTLSHHVVPRPRAQRWPESKRRPDRAEPAEDNKTKTRGTRPPHGKGKGRKSRKGNLRKVQKIIRVGLTGACAMAGRQRKEKALPPAAPSRHRPQSEQKRRLSLMELEKIVSHVGAVHVELGKFSIGMLALESVMELRSLRSSVGQMASSTTDALSPRGIARAASAVPESWQHVERCRLMRLLSGSIGWRIA